MMPVRHDIRSDTDSFSYSPVATKGLDKLRYHTPLSQIVTTDARGNYHNMCVAGQFLPAHSVLMDESDKNGGPNHLRAWRVFRDISQAALAERVGTNANMIQYLETGERGLSAKWLRKLAPALETTPGMLLDHDPHELDADILSIWGNADSRQKKQISEVAKALLKTGTGD